MKTSNSVLNFSTELAKKPSMYILLFLSALCSPKNDNKRPSEIRNQHHSSHFTIIEVFLVMGPILATGLKYWLTVKFLQIFFCLETVL